MGGRSGGTSGQTQTGPQDGDLQSGTDDGGHGEAGSSGGHVGAGSSEGHGRCKELRRPWWCRELRRPWQVVFMAVASSLSLATPAGTLLSPKIISLGKLGGIRSPPGLDRQDSNSDVRAALSARTSAFKSGNFDDQKQASCDLRKSIKAAKRQYKTKVEEQFNTNNARSMWQGINNITDFKGNKPATVNIAASLRGSQHRPHRERSRGCCRRGECNLHFCR